MPRATYRTPLRTFAAHALDAFSGDPLQGSRGSPKNHSKVLFWMYSQGSLLRLDFPVRLWVHSPGSPSMAVGVPLRTLKVNAWVCAQRILFRAMEAPLRSAAKNGFRDTLGGTPRGSHSQCRL